MRTDELFRLLACGIHPESGMRLPEGSVVHSPDAIRLLFVLAEEFKDERFFQVKRGDEVKLTPEERRQKNLDEGRPANAYLPWKEEEQQQLLEAFTRGATISELAAVCERTSRSIALKPEKLRLINAEEAAVYAK